MSDKVFFWTNITMKRSNDILFLKVSRKVSSFCYNILLQKSSSNVIRNFFNLSITFLCFWISDKVNNDLSLVRENKTGTFVWLSLAGKIVCNNFEAFWKKTVMLLPIFFVFFVFNSKALLFFRSPSFLWKNAKLVRFGFFLFCR